MSVGDVAEKERDGPPGEFAVRLFTIFEVIANHGPVSLIDIAAITGIPKVSAWRICRTLRAYGWIRQRLNERDFELSPRLDNLLAGAYVPPQEISDIDMVLDSLAVSSGFEVSVGVLAGYGRYVVLDATSDEHSGQQTLSLVNDVAPMAALLCCSRLDVLRHYEAYMRSATEEERRVISSGQAIAELYAYAEGIFAWAGDGLSFALPWVFATGTCGSVEIGARQDSREGKRKLREKSVEIRSNLLKFPQIPIAGANGTISVLAETNSVKLKPRDRHTA